MTAPWLHQSPPVPRSPLLLAEEGRCVAAVRAMPSQEHEAMERIALAAHVDVPQARLLLVEEGCRFGAQSLPAAFLAGADRGRAEVAS